MTAPVPPSEAAASDGALPRRIADGNCDALAVTVQARMVLGMHQPRTLLHGFPDAEGTRP